MTVAKVLGILACAILAPLTFAAVVAAEPAKDFNGYQCDAVTVRYVEKEKVSLPDGDKTVKVYNAVATGCVVKGEAPRKGATKKGQNLAIRSDDVESPAEGSDKAFTGRYLVACLKMDAGDGTGTVTGTHCHVVHPSGGEPLV